MSNYENTLKVTNKNLLEYFQKLNIKYLDFFLSKKDHEVVFIFPKSKFVLDALHTWKSIYNKRWEPERPAN